MTLPAAPLHEAYAALLVRKLVEPADHLAATMRVIEEEAEHLDPETLRRLVASARERAHAVDRTVEELAALTALVAGAPPSPATGATELSALLAATAGNARVALRVDAGAEAAAVDRERLALILRALLDIAARFPQTRTTAIRAAMDGERPALALTIVFEGLDITPALKEAVFELFPDGRDGDRRRGGIGACLTVARRAAEGGGGSLSLAPGEWTAFRLELPVAGPTVEAEPAAGDGGTDGDADAREIQIRLLRDRLERADGQALRTTEDLMKLVHTLNSVVQRERRARAEAETLDRHLRHYGLR